MSGVSEILLPCPFCGSVNIDPKGWASADRSGPACDDCGGSADTIALWNARPEVSSLRARVAELEKIDLEASHMFRALNGMDIDEWDKRAERLMQTALDGLHICDDNRLMVKGLLAEHFADIGARAERAEAQCKVFFEQKQNAEEACTRAEAELAQLQDSESIEAITLRTDLVRRRHPNPTEENDGTS